jgi:DNA-binding CsgD family transcriptional regulator/tetratricopeptide (TPR) repeat protein
MSPVMVGRDSELDQLVQLATSGRPQIAIVAGEPGIGKSRLVQELVGGLQPGTRVLVGQADPGALGRPFELLLDAVDASVDRALLDPIVDPARSLVERLRAGLDMVQALTTPGPAVVVFEDLHWADSESVALFERIAELPAGARLLVGTYRPDEVTRRHPVAELLTRLERRHSVTHVRLHRLRAAGTAAMLTAVAGRAPSFRAATALHNRTGGNPFFLEELVKAGMAGHSQVDLDRLCEQPLPWNLAEALRHQLDDLGPSAQRMVEAAAVLGRRVPFDLLAAVTGSAEEELLPVLRELVDRGLMVETGEDEFGFRHALVREAVEEQLLGRQRRRLHEIALDRLLAGGDDDYAMIAHHARGAGRYDDLVAAARRGCAAYLALGSAYQALQLAETGLEELPDDAELLAGAAHAAWLAGLVDDAVRHARRWLRLAGTVEDRSAALRLLVRLSWEASRIDEMNELTELVRGVVDEMPEGAERARAMAALAQSYMLRGQPEAAVGWAERAVALTDRLGLPEVRLAALVEKGSALMDRSGSIDQGRALLAEVAERAERAGEWLLAARALNNLVTNVPPAAATDHAALLERMRGDAERAGFDSLAVAAYFQGRARLAMREGDLAAAVAALEAGRVHDRGYVLTGRDGDYHGVFLAGLAIESGELDRAAAVLAGLPDVSSRAHVSLPGLRFNIACRRGELDRARTALAEICAAADKSGWLTGDHLHDLVSAGLAGGLAEPELRVLVERGGGEEELGAWGVLVEAQLAEAAGHPERAVDGYARAAVDHVLPPAVRGTAYAGAARGALSAGRPDEARAHLDSSQELLSGWAGWRVDEVRALRTRLGLAAPDGAERAGAGLTPREREVAVLLADGLTNAELARRLFISPKTAAVHVSNILAKLGLSSRTEVAAWVRAHDPSAGARARARAARQ